MHGIETHSIDLSKDLSHASLAREKIKFWLWYQVITTSDRCTMSDEVSCCKHGQLAQCSLDDDTFFKETLSLFSSFNIEDELRIQSCIK